jgi:hypothetical protein
METPNPARHEPDSVYTPDTVISSIFDNGNESPLSSSISPVSSYSERDSNYEKESPHKQPALDNATQDTVTWVNPDYYGTAASRREPRKRTSQPQYYGFFSEPRKQSIKKIKTQTQPPCSREPEGDAEQTIVVLPRSSTTAAENHPEPPAPRVCKRKAQAPAPDVTTESPQKRVKEGTATRRSLRPRPTPQATVTEDVRSSPAPPRQLRKRKVSPITVEAEQSPPSKRSRTNSARPRAAPKPKSKSPTAKGEPGVEASKRAIDTATSRNEIRRI